MKYVPKEITEEVNVTRIHPLRYLAKVSLILSVWGILFYVASGIVADQIAQVLDPKLEANIGRSLAAPFAASDIRPEAEQQLQTLLDELQQQQKTRAPKAQIHVIESEAINAGVLPGGQMIMTTALLDTVQSENELAFVLAHELGHHELRHPSRRLGRSLLWIIILSILGVGQQTPTMADPSVPVTVADLQFSRTQEQEADRFALGIIAAKYGHIDHALDFFKRLQDQHDSLNQRIQPEFLTTHPFPKNRIKDLQRYAQVRNWSTQGPLKKLNDSIIGE